MSDSLITDEGIVRLTSRTAGDVEMVPFFELDGKTHSIPAAPSSSMALRYLRNVRHYGQEIAVAEALEELIGTEGYDALCAADLDADTFTTLMAVLERHILGAVEGKVQRPPSGSHGSANGSAKSAG